MADSNFSRLVFRDWVAEAGCNVAEPTEEFMGGGARRSCRGV